MAKKPVKRQDFPTWWHPSGAKLKLEPNSSWYPVSVVLKSDSAGLIVMKAWDMQKAWHVIWVITHSLAEHSDGNVWMSSEELETAFGNQAHAVVKDKYTRIKSHLVIPGPGGISVLVTNEIREAVQRLVGAWRTAPSESDLAAAR